MHLGGVVAFAGSRHGSPFAVSPVVAAVASAGGSVRVGCARGVDQAVRVACPSAHVLHAQSQQPRHLAARTRAVVIGASALVVFPPSSGVLGPGSTLAVSCAIAQNLPVWVAGPSAPGAGWVSQKLAGLSGFLYAPQSSLFSVVHALI